MTSPSQSPEAAAFGTGATIVRTLITLVLLATLWLHIVFVIPVYEAMMNSVGASMSGVSSMAVGFSRYFGGFAIGLMAGLVWLRWKAREGEAEKARFAAAHGITNLLLVIYLAMVSMVYLDFAKIDARIVGPAPAAATPTP